MDGCSFAVVMSAAARSLVESVMTTVVRACTCPAHAAGGRHVCRSDLKMMSAASTADPGKLKEYAFEMSTSTIRFGNNVTQEVGQDFQMINAKNVCVVTDPQVCWCC